VVVVGNRTAGGAGKTPLVIALAQALTAHGWSVGIVSRGYGRSGSAAVTVRVDSLPESCGDEPLLIHRSTGLPVEVDVDRVAAAKRLQAAGCTLVLADDGLQHLRLGRSAEIEVQDGRGLGNARVLPAGPLREPLPARRAFATVVHGRALAPGETLMKLALGTPRRLGGDELRPLVAFAGQPVHAVAGIGDPARFFTALRAAGLAPIPHPFPDHHRYVDHDFASLSAATVLMTAKDAVKCEGFGLSDAWELPLEATLPEAFVATLDAFLRSAPPHVDP